MEIGQITLQKEIGDQLGFKPFDKTKFVVWDGEAILSKVSHSANEVAGTFPLPTSASADPLGHANGERFTPIA